ALPARHAAAAAPHHRRGHRDPGHLDVQLRRSHLRDDQRRARQCDADHVGLYAAHGLLEPRLRLPRHALGRVAGDHAALHRLLPARHARDRERDVNGSRGSLAERTLGGPVLWGGLVLLTAFALAPFVWVFLTSLKTRTELYATPLQYLPGTITMINYVDPWTSKLTPFRRFFANRLWVSSVTMVANPAVAILAGYALARFRFGGRHVTLVVCMYPTVV